MALTAFPIPTTQVSTAIGNLMGAANEAAARTALGLGTAAVAATGDFDAAGAAAAVSAALSPLTYSAGGWLAGEAWTYVSASTFTVAADVTAKYARGDRLMLTQTTVKYFYVIAVSAFGSGVTTITVSGGSDYTLANAAITSPFYSKQSTPNGFPQWFNYIAVWVGWSAGPTTPVSRFALQGRTCLIAFNTQGGTASAASKTVSLPITSANISDQTWNGFVSLVNSGSGGTSASKIRISPNASVANLYLNWDNANSASSGTTFFYDGGISYEI